VQEIEQLRIDGFDFICAVIAQDIIYIGQRLRQILPLEPIDGAEMFPGVRVVKGERPFWGLKSTGVAQSCVWAKAHGGCQDPPLKKAAAIESVIGQRCLAHS
jgi:hypothetical protein